MMDDKRAELIKRLEALIEDTEWSDIVDLSPQDAKDILGLLKEQETMNVDAFVQWCIDSHIMGDATVRGIKYWVEKYKEFKE